MKKLIVLNYIVLFILNTNNDNQTVTSGMIDNNAVTTKTIRDLRVLPPHITTSTVDSVTTNNLCFGAYLDIFGDLVILFVSLVVTVGDFIVASSLYS